MLWLKDNCRRQAGSSHKGAVARSHVQRKRRGAGLAERQKAAPSHVPRTVKPEAGTYLEMAQPVQQKVCIVLCCRIVELCGTAALGHPGSPPFEGPGRGAGFPARTVFQGANGDTKMCQAELLFGAAGTGTAWSGKGGEPMQLQQFTKLSCICSRTSAHDVEEIRAKAADIARREAELQASGTLGSTDLPSAAKFWKSCDELV